MDSKIKETICQEHIAGKNLTQLEKEYGYGRRVLEKLLRQRGIFKRRGDIIRDRFPILKNHKELNDMYHLKKMTIEEMANFIGVSTQIIKNVFKEHNIRFRTYSEATINEMQKRVPRLLDTLTLKSKYEEGMSLSAIAHELEVSDTAVKTALSSVEIVFRTHKEQMVKNTELKPINKVNSKIAKNLRSRLSIALKNNQKKGSAVKDLGCSIEEFKAYLQSKFYNSDNNIPMCWENYGKYGWEIDHVSPLSMFDLSIEEKLKDACHYTNLAPVWRVHNRAKSALPVGAKPKRVPLLIVTGPSGSGKSWVLKQLGVGFDKLSYDLIPKEQHYHYLVEMSKSGNPIVYDPLRKPLSIYNRYRSLFDAKLIVIDESVDTIKARIIKRGGSKVNNVETFVKKNQKLIPIAHFSGTSSEVAEYLKTLKF